MNHDPSVETKRITPRDGQLRADRRGSYKFSKNGKQLLVYICASGVNVDDPDLIKEIFRVYNEEKTNGHVPVDDESPYTQIILSRSQAGNYMITYYVDESGNEWNAPLNYDIVYAPPKQRGR